MNEKLFGYTLSDSWGGPILGVNIYNRKDSNVECVIWSLSEISKLDTSADTYSLPEETITQIRVMLLNHSKLSEMQTISFPLVIDGFENDFFIDCAGIGHGIHASNLAILLNQESHYYKNPPAYAMELFEVFNSIKQILLDNGVDEKYLALTLE